MTVSDMICGFVKVRYRLQRNGKRRYENGKRPGSYPHFIGRGPLSRLPERAPPISVKDVAGRGNRSLMAVRAADMANRVRICRSVVRR